MSIDALVEQAFSFGKKKDYEQLDVLLTKHFEILLKSTRAWPAIIDAAKSEPAQNTMLLAVVGGLRANQTEADAKAQVLMLTELLVHKGDPKQLAKRELALVQLRQMVVRYTAVIRESKDYKRGLRVLSEGMHVFIPEEHVSPFHSSFVQLCLLSKAPDMALATLEKPLYHVEPSVSGVKAVDFMSYYYYGGIAYLALHNVKKAREFFRNVFCVPAQAVSLVMVLAFKALTLTNAIADPIAISFPSHIDARHERVIRQIAAPYVDLVAALEARDEASVTKLLETERTTFETDDLFGLVKQALAAAPRQAILSLTRIYVALTLEQIADQVKVPIQEVEVLLGSMIARGEIDATIDASHTVKFGQGALPTLEDLRQQIDTANALSEKIRNIDDTVIVSSPFVMAKLRNTPNLRDILADFELKRKSSRSMVETVQDAFRGGH